MHLQTNDYSNVKTTHCFIKNEKHKIDIIVTQHYGSYRVDKITKNTSK